MSTRRDPCNADESKQLKFKEDRIRYWLSVGAQPSETVTTLIKRAGIDAKSGTTYQPPAPVEASS